MIIHNVVQGTPEWLEVRKATITGSRAKALKTMPIDPAKVAKIDWKSNKTRPPAYVTLMNEMMAEDLAPLPEGFKNDAMERGNIFEPFAREEYEKVTGQKVDEIGFCTHDTRRYLGLSPDGFIAHDREDPNEYTKAIEIKCMGPKNHIKVINSGKIPEEHEAQIVHNFLVCETLEELDYVVFNPDMYLESLKIHIINVKREDYLDQIEETFKKLDIISENWEKNILELTSKNEKEKDPEKDTKTNTKA